MLSKFKLNQLYFKDTQFANLMTRRIFNVLLIANPYDAFMLEDDGRIDEKIFNEYTSLSLRYPPRFTQVSTCEEALTQLASISFDLIICMPGTGDNDSFAVARYIKSLYEQISRVCGSLKSRFLLWSFPESALLSSDPPEYARFLPE